MAMTIAVYRVTRDSITERIPKHEVAPASEPLMSNRFPLCHFPIHTDNPCAPENERAFRNRG
jgi:hypothetical protein